MFVRITAKLVYWTVAIIAHLCAKAVLAWTQFYNPEHPGVWKQ